MERRRALAQRRVLNAAPIALALIGVSTNASAYCRATTCEPAIETCTKDEHGCVREGARLRWTRLPLTYRVAARGSSAFDRDEARARIAAAFDTWTRAVCPDGRRTSLTVVEGDAMPTDKPLGEKRASDPFGIYFRDDAWPYPSGATTLAITNQDFSKSSGRILYADIEVNTQRTNLASLGIVLTHEAGHWLGLAHGLEPGSIMNETYSVAQRAELSPDDVAGICELFPPDGLPPEDDGGCAVASDEHTPRDAACPLALVVGMLLARRRLQR